MMEKQQLKVRKAILTCLVLCKELDMKFMFKNDKQTMIKSYLLHCVTQESYKYPCRRFVQGLVKFQQDACSFGRSQITHGSRPIRIPRKSEALELILN